MKMVQVTSEAKARPIMTALTTMSADLNIVQGDNSLSSAVAAFSTLASRSAGVAAASEAAAGAAAWGCATGDCDAAGACWAKGAGGAAGVAFCWADDGTASDSIASTETTATAVTRERDMFIILRPSGGSGCDRYRSI